MTKPKDKPDEGRALRLIRGRCQEVGDCWLWQGAKGGSGKLPCMHHEGKTRYVRRIVYELVHKQAVGKRVVSPACENPLCVSPEHMEAMPRRVALKRAGKRGAYSRPEKVLISARTQRAKSRYSDELVAMIRASEDGPTKVSRETGMSVSYIKAIRRGKSRIDYASPFAGLFTGLMSVGTTLGAA